MATVPSSPAIGLSNHLGEARADVAEADRLDGAAFDQRPLDRLQRGVQGVAVEVRPPLEAALGEAAVELAPQLRRRVDVAVLAPPLAQPGPPVGGDRVVAETALLVVPARRRSGEALAVELVEDQQAAGCEQLRDPVERAAEVVDVVQREARRGGGGGGGGGPATTAANEPPSPSKSSSRTRRKIGPSGARGSIAVTRQPARARARARSPSPQPTSSTRTCRSGSRARTNAA